MYNISHISKTQQFNKLEIKIVQKIIETMFYGKIKTMTKSSTIFKLTKTEL